MSITYCGVTYDTGTNFATGQGSLSRLAWSEQRMHEEIAAIKDQLNCNSVTVYGSDLTRLAGTARAAVERGLHVWLQPRLVDRPQDEVLDQLGETARLAESLRRDGAAIGLAAGCVQLVFTPGIAPGDQYHERMANVFPDADHRVLVPTGRVDLEAANARLNAFLDRASAVVRDNFAGMVSYSAAPFEDVDWRLFDVVGLMHFYTLRYPASRTEHLAELARYRRWGKPVMIAEFGTATHAQAPGKAFLSFDIVDRHRPVPTVFDGYRRDERTQADFHLEMLATFEEAAVLGVSVSEFIHPTHPHSPDPRLDLDAASMAIVKTIRDTYHDPASPYRWEPKRSFQAIAGYYAAAARRRA
jgi:hypothetical protein